MKRNIDQFLANEARLQEYLVWVRDKSNSVEADQKIAAIREFYYSLHPSLDHDRNFSLYLDLYLSLYLSCDFSQDINLKLLDLSPDLNSAIKHCLDRKLREILQQLQQQLPDRDLDREIKKQWWKNNGATWKNELRQAMIKYRNIGHEWNFNQQQIELIKQYLTANKLLMECLNSECYVSREVREEIEDSLFLPFADLNYD